MFEFIARLIHAVLAPLAEVMGALLPSWIRLPDLKLVLPHYMYWPDLILFPLVVMCFVWWEKNRKSATEIPWHISATLAVSIAVMAGPILGILLGAVLAAVGLEISRLWEIVAGAVFGVALSVATLRSMRRHIGAEGAENAKRNRVTLPIAYLLLIAGGFAGLHRFYLRSAWLGSLYVLFFLVILYGNWTSADARNLVSAAQNDFRGAVSEVDRFTKAVRSGAEGAQAKLAKAEATLATVKAELADAGALFNDWRALVGGFAFLILVFLIADAFLVPRLRRRCLEKEPDVEEVEHEITARGPKPDPRHDIHTGFTRFVESISGWSGQFVAYWSPIAVFVYYYEVIARHVFNSPTNWAHEGMFLMFGMQYLLAGAYAYREDAHVRVDVIYEKWSPRGRAIVDLITSVFFFIFVAALLGTGAIFARDSIQVWEVSFTEWAIQYWPVKLTIVLGALILLLQGTAKVVRDVVYLRSTGR